MSWNLLERFIESDHFNEDPSLSVAYLSCVLPRYADHVGIHYVLCSKLRRFSYDEIEFFLPQLCHLLISVDNESMALEEFIIDLCEESVNAALLTFWLFQTYLHDLAGNPQSNDFKTCRRLYNKVQRIVFGASEPANRDRIRGNVLPVTVLSSLILATVAAPFLPRHAGPLAVAQARKPRMSTETISDASQTQTQKLVRSNTVAGGSPRPRKPRPQIVRLNPAEATSLNSAERVPYLLMVEVLREDFDFNPDSEVNQTLLTRLLAEKGTNKRRLFDLSDSSRQAIPDKPPDPGVDSVFEPTDGDLGSKDLLIKDPAEEELANGMAKTALASNGYTAVRINPAPQMLAQLEASGSKRPKTEMAAIKSKIIASMQNLEEQSFYMDETPTFDSIMAEPKPTALTAEPEDLDDAAVDPNASNSAGAARMENDSKTGGIQRKGDRDDPSAATFGEDWTAKKERIRRSSPYGWMKNWDLISVIVKTGADLRQEAFACQLIQVCCKIWQDAEVPVWVKRMRILVTGESSGLIETITNGVSLHSLKRSLTLASIAAGTNPRKRIATLRDHFVQTFGEADSETNGAAVDAFARSLAAYSIISYVLQLKDRHNGNILIDNQGHIIHIDFGFMLSNTPGSMGFEAAPFKLTQEYVDVLGGVGSPGYNLFKMLCKQAFQALRKEAERIVMLVEMMGKSSQMPCFAAGVQQAVAALRSRFMLQLSKEEAEYFVDDLIGKSVGSYYTRLYDTFQYRTQGIY
ncbi:putative phosphatidylinositol 4-kinase pik1 protein [Neofusicoccum parvum UCRNP2]|uniref:1-phosphatidylinositol 4-kinase n=1 Tax=Botryosphaeria parva (strain UCR-NP2) TaxID=1287680 RepID=R1EF34_BOTPV|nr:putative phosphatidylinositol 4-kinase pik1 protein [Neofusicoccum parvum UCRNP2]